MKISEKIKLVFKKINIFDVVVIAIVAIAATIGIFMYLKGKQPKDVNITEVNNKVEAEFVLKIPEVKIMKEAEPGQVLSEIQNKDYFKVGQEVYTKFDGFYVGEIEKVEFKPQEENIVDTENGVVRQEMSSKYSDIYLYIKNKDAIKSGTGANVSGIKVVIDSECSVIIDGYLCTAKVSDIIK